MTAQSTAAPAVRASKLARTYGDKDALAGIDLELSRPGVTAILGPNGAGKTTFVHCALGLTNASSGDIQVFGKAPGSMENRRRTGVMLQDADLPDLLTAREHVTLFASYYPAPLPTDEILALCDITGFADKRYKKLSGGQKRRVQFALSIVGQPDLIFLDEPTTGLDIDARRILWDIVRSLADSGKVIVLTTHYLDEADALADRIIVLNAGNVIADGPTSTIREAVGGALIRCATSVPDSQLQQLPGVTQVRRAGRFADLLSQDATRTLKALLDIDTNVSELTVRKPNLEEAFLELTATPTGDSP